MGFLDVGTSGSPSTLVTVVCVVLCVCPQHNSSILLCCLKTVVLWKSQHNNLKLLCCGFSGRWHLWATVLMTRSLRRENWGISTLYRWCSAVSGLLRCALVRHFQPRVHHISMSHERPCFICFVVWPTTSLKSYIVFWDGGETRVSIVSHLKMHTDLITVRG